MRSEPELIADPTRPRAYILRIGGADQSYVDLDDPRRLEFDYVQRLADLIDVLAPPGQRLRIIHVGGAGMTLPRYVMVTRPRSAQIVLEPDVGLTALVRRQLPIPPRSGIRIRPVDGATGIAALPDGCADLVVVDAFVGVRVPAELTMLEFLADAARVVAPAGVLALNVTDRGPFPYGRRVAAGVAATFTHSLWSAEPATMKGRRFGNVLVVGSATPLPVAEFARRAGSGPYPYRVVHGVGLVQLIAGARPFAGDDVSASPVPPLMF